MPTIMQKNLAKEIIKNAKRKKPLNKGELLEKVGYSKNTLETKPTEVLEAQGVQEALEEYGFTEDNAKKVVSSILLNEKVEPNARIKAAQEVFKVRGSYAPEKSLSLNIDVSSEIEEKANEVITRFLNGTNRNSTKQ